MAKSTGTCNVKGCDNAAKTRGLCVTHYCYMMQGIDEKRREAIAAVANPPTRGVNAPARQSEKPPEISEPGRTRKGVPDMPNPIPPPPAKKDRDEIIAAITEFATAMGIDRLEVSDGFIFANHGRLMLLTPNGHLRPAKVELSPALPRV